MMEEREIAGLSVPFAGGAVAGLLLCPALSPSTIHPLCGAMFLLTAVLTFLLPLTIPLHSRTKSLLFASGICILAGLFCALNHSLTSGVPAIRPSVLKSLAGDAVASLRSCIEAIPYHDPDTPALLNALMTGDRSQLSKDTIGIFRQSGASHILALSGLHLGLIYLMLSKLTMPLGNSPKARKIRYGIVVGASLFYCIMTGAGPSISRAAIFIFLGETARVTGREKDPVRILLAALTIQIGLDPSVASSVGFQLSYLAMAGLVLVFPKLKSIYPEAESRWWRKADPFKKVWNAAMMSISCQLFTGPLVWLRFHTFPEFFLITNLVALPMTSVIMVLSVTTITLSSIGLCPMFLVTLDEWAVQTLVHCLETIASL